MTGKRVVKRKCAVLIVGTLTVMLPMTLSASFAEDCKDKLMDVFTRVCGTDRYKRGIEKFDLTKAEYKKLELVESSSDLSFEPVEVPVASNIPDKRDVVSKTTESSAIPTISDSEQLFEVVSAPASDESRHRESYYPYKRRAASISSYRDAPAEKDKLGFEMTDEEMLELYADLNDRLPRSFTQLEWKKILWEFTKTCCYEDNTCDSENIDILCS